MELTRRQFLSKTATAVIVAGMMAHGRVFGANNRIRMCTVGFNGQGGGHIRNIMGMKDEEIVQLLFDSAIDLGPTGPENEYGYGLANLKRFAEL